MYALRHDEFSRVQLQLERVAKLNVKVTISRNIINFSIATVDILGKIAFFKAKLLCLKTFLKTSKDVSALFVFIVTAAEILTFDFWTSTKTSLAKKGNRFCKLIYSGLETFVIIPNRWKQISSSTSTIIGKDLFVISSALFAIWHSTEEIREANRVIQKNEARLKSLTFRRVIEDHPHSLTKIALEIFELKNKITHLNSERSGLPISGSANVHKIYKIAGVLEKLKAQLYQKQEKRRRLLSIKGKNSNSNDFQQVIEYKITKACIKIDLNRSQVKKANLIRSFELTKITLVGLQILLTSGLVATSSPLIGSAIFVSGLGIGSISLALTFYDLFYWRNPKMVKYPTTNLNNKIVNLEPFLQS